MVSHSRFVSQQSQHDYEIRHLAHISQFQTSEAEPPTAQAHAAKATRHGVLRRGITVSQELDLIRSETLESLLKILAIPNAA